MLRDPFKVELFDNFIPDNFEENQIDKLKTKIRK